MVSKQSTKGGGDPFNNFKVGDILEVCFEPNVDSPEWVRFFSQPLRDNADVEWAKEIVATHGACFGYASASLSKSQPHTFRTVTR